MKKTTLLAAAFTGFGAVVVLAPTAVADPRVSLPFVPVAVPLEPPPSDPR